MAEILLSLTIIGVVAAITLPSLTGNINERTWNTQRKALYARMSQAIALMPALNGYGQGATTSETKSIATQTFLTDGLSKVLKINNICDNKHLADCGIPSKITDFNGSQLASVPDTLYNLNSAFSYYKVFTNSAGGTYTHSVTVADVDAGAFETISGESIIAYYNPACTADIDEQRSNGEKLNYAQKSMCVNFVYDLNGSKGPNTVGKDIGFITVMYPSDSNVVAVSPYGSLSGQGGDFSAANRLCKERYGEGRAPNYDEGAAVFVNKKFLGSSLPEILWTTSSCDSGKAWRVSTAIGYRNCTTKAELRGMSLYCIRRMD